MIQRTCDLKDYDHNIFFTGNLTYASWSSSILIDHMINGIYNLRIKEVILIGYNTTLLDYGHQLIWSLHAVDSRSHTLWTRIFHVRSYSIGETRFLYVKN